MFDLFCANYGLDRGLGGDWVTSDYSSDMPGTPAWAEKITGVKADKIIHVAREFAQNAEKTEGKSMVIIGAAMNHWYHMDMNYRGVINMLVMCGCVGQSGGGWAHYVGQEKLRPQTGWQPLAFALDWGAPAAAHELDLCLVCPYRSMALRDAEIGRDPVAHRARGRLGRLYHRLQHPGGTDGLAALGTAAERPTRWRLPKRRKRRARKSRPMSPSN